MSAILVISASDAHGIEIGGGDMVIVDDNPYDVREIDGMFRVEGDPRWDINGEGIEVSFCDGSEIIGVHRLKLKRFR